VQDFLSAFYPFSPGGNVTTTVVILVLAAFCGGVIGLERELRGKPAGLRTFMLIACGSALFTLCSIWAVDTGGGLHGDTSRVMAQIVSGVGFLGAGAILQSRGSVIGLTTAATVWATAALGMTIGLQKIPEAIGATGIMVIIIIAFDAVERYIRTHVGMRYRVAITFDRPKKKYINDLREFLNSWNVRAWRLEGLLLGGREVPRLPTQEDAPDAPLKVLIVMRYPFGGFQQFMEKLGTMGGVSRVEFEPLFGDEEDVTPSAAKAMSGDMMMPTNGRPGESGLSNGLDQETMRGEQPKSGRPPLRRE